MLTTSISGGSSETSTAPKPSGDRSGLLRIAGFTSVSCSSAAACSRSLSRHRRPHSGPVGSHGGGYFATLAGVLKFSVAAADSGEGARRLSAVCEFR